MKILPGLYYEVGEQFFFIFLKYHNIIIRLPKCINNKKLDNIKSLKGGDKSE